jgi:hypothetical protein
MNKTKKVKWYSGKGQNLRQALSSGVEFSFVSADDFQKIEILPLTNSKSSVGRNDNGRKGHFYREKK